MSVRKKKKKKKVGLVLTLKKNHYFCKQEKRGCTEQDRVPHQRQRQHKAEPSGGKLKAGYRRLI